MTTTNTTDSRQLCPSDRKSLRRRRRSGSGGLVAACAMPATSTVRKPTEATAVAPRAGLESRRKLQNTPKKSRCFFIISVVVEQRCWVVLCRTVAAQEQVGVSRRHTTRPASVCEIQFTWKSCDLSLASKHAGNVQAPMFSSPFSQPVVLGSLASVLDGRIDPAYCG